MTLRPRIVFTPDCHWEIPVAWWRMVAQPKFSQLVLAGARDPNAITYSILQGETGTCPLPPQPDMVVSPPNAPNYWPGPPTALFLFQHVREAVAGGIAQFTESAPPRLALPPGILD